MDSKINRNKVLDEQREINPENKGWKVLQIFEGEEKKSSRENTLINLQ